MLKCHSVGLQRCHWRDAFTRTEGIAARSMFQSSRQVCSFKQGETGRVPVTICVPGFTNRTAIVRCETLCTHVVYRLVSTTRYSLRGDTSGLTTEGTVCIRGYQYMYVYAKALQPESESKFGVIGSSESNDTMFSTNKMTMFTGGQ